MIELMLYRRHPRRSIPLKSASSRFCLLLSIVVLLQAHSAGRLTESFPLARAAQQDVSNTDQQSAGPGDLTAVRVYRQGLRSVVEFAASRPGLFPPEKLEKTRMLGREQREEVRSAWKRFLDYILALDSISQYHAQASLEPDAQREESFLIAYGAFLAQYRFALEFINRVENDPGLDTLLNEPIGELGLPTDSYAQFKFRFLNVARASEFVTWETRFKSIGGSLAPDVRKNIQEDSDRLWEMGKNQGLALTAQNALQIMRQSAFTAWFPVQITVSEWVGHTKVARLDRSLITLSQIQTMAGQLEPGDIVLERREWYLSNVGLPGYWPHAALFIGTPELRQQYFNDPDVQEWVRQQGQADGQFEALLRSKHPKAYAESFKRQEEGHAVRILEAIAKGVSFSSLEHSAGADTVAVVRPRLSKPEKAAALLRAFGYAGLPYDYNFDFLTDAELVCTELIYKSYEPAKGFRGIRFPLGEVLGRRVMPANEIAQVFDQEYGTPQQQMDFVLFLDGHEQQGKAINASVKEFRESWKRPKWHLLTQDLKPKP